MSVSRSELDLPSLLSAASHIYPGWSLRAVKSKATFLLACLRVRPQLCAFLGRSENARFREEFRARPDMLGFVVWP